MSSDTGLLKQYQLLVNSATENVATVNLLSDDLRDLARPAEEAVTLGYMDVPPPDELVSSIEDIHDQASTLRKKYRDTLQELDALLRRVPEKATEDGPSLETALALLDEQRAEERRERVQRRVEEQQEVIADEVAEFRIAAEKRSAEAEKERDKNIADAKVEAAKLVGESEATLIATSARAVADEAKRQAELKAEINAEEQLNHEYQLAKPDIYRYLGPFIRDGYAQPQGQINRQGATKAKMSLSAIRASRALEPGRGGLGVLAYIASNNNDRFRNDFPQFLGDEWGWQQLDKEWLSRAQELLTKYGDLMIKDNLLSE